MPLTWKHAIQLIRIHIIMFEECHCRWLWVTWVISTTVNLFLSNVSGNTAHNTVQLIIEAVVRGRAITFATWHEVILWFFNQLSILTTHKGHVDMRSTYNQNYTTRLAIKTCRLVFDYTSGGSWSIFLTFCTSGNRNEYSTIYLYHGLMTS